MQLFVAYTIFWCCLVVLLTDADICFFFELYYFKLDIKTVHLS